MADNNNGNPGILIVILIVCALASAALLLHLRKVTDWSHGASSTAGIARYGFDRGRPEP